MSEHELMYLRAVMEWLQSGGKYEPLDFEDIYRDYAENIKHGKSSDLQRHVTNTFIAPKEDECPPI